MDYKIENEYASSLIGQANGKMFYIKTKLDGNEIFTRKWFEDNLGKKVIRIDTPKIDTKYRKKETNKITNLITRQEVTVSEELYQSQFGWDMRYKLID